MKVTLSRSVQCLVCGSLVIFPGCAAYQNVQIVTEPVGATVSLNGKPKGLSPMSVKIPVDSFANALGNNHTISAKLPGYYDESRTLHSDSSFYSNLHPYPDVITFKLRMTAEEAERKSTAFRARAAKWRELSPKPPLSDAVNKQRVLAEGAIQEKNFEKAVKHYESALELEPCWPSGHFNCAVIEAESGHFASAAYHMNCYIELAPEAPDAKSAREKAIIWSDKAREKPQ